MPLPRGPIQPMLAYSRDDPFDSDEFSFEVKWDGTRTVAWAGEGDRRFQNRRLRSIAYRYPEIDPEVKVPAILDGEIVVMDQGKPSFARLQQREHVSEAFRAGLLAEQLPATYVVFDILHWKDRSLLRLPLEERRAILEEVVEPNEHVYLSEPIRRTGIALFEVAKARGLEGIMAKKLGTPYEVGKRVDYWLKIKTYVPQLCVVAGLTLGTGWRAPYFGALILGAYWGEELRFIGRVGTGFDQAKLEEIQALARPYEGTVPFPEEPEGEPVKFWLRPALVAEVKYLEFTSEGKLRAPVFVRMRPDLTPADCVLPEEYPGN
ncbi:MAG: non-homologous end-joining DNA ligase [Thermoplasmata archaeon]